MATFQPLVEMGDHRIPPSPVDFHGTNEKSEWAIRSSRPLKPGFMTKKRADEGQQHIFFGLVDPISETQGGVSKSQAKMTLGNSFQIYPFGKKHGEYK